MKRYVYADDDLDIMQLQAAELEDAFHEDPNVRRWLAEETEDPEILNILIYDPNPNVTGCVLENKKFAPTPDMLSELSDSPNWYMRKFAASHKKTPPDILVKLSKDSNGDVREAAVRNSRFPMDQIPEDVSDSRVGHGLVMNRKASQEAISRVVKSGDWYALEGLAKSKRTSPEVLRQLAQDQSLTSRLQPWQVNLIQGGIIKNPNTPADVLEYLISNGTVRSKVELAKRSDLAANICELLSKDDAPRVRSTIAANSATPENILRTLAKDSQYSVRRGVASNPNTPEDVQLTLATDKSMNVRHGLAYCKDLSEAVIRKLVESCGSQIATSLLWSENHVPADIIRSWYAENPDRLGWYLSRNPYTPSDVLRRIMQSNDHYASNRAAHTLENRGELSNIEYLRYFREDY